MRLSPTCVLQLTGYANRFGPGLVLYWGGYVDSLEALAPREIVVAADLPSIWTLPGDERPRTIAPEHSTPLLLERVLTTRATAASNATSAALVTPAGSA